MQRTFLAVASATALLPGIAYAAHTPDYVEMVTMDFTEFQNALNDAGGGEILSRLTNQFTENPAVTLRADNNYLIKIDDGKLAIATTAYDVTGDPDAQVFFGKVTDVKLSSGDEIALTDVLHFLIAQAKAGGEREVINPTIDDQKIAADAVATQLSTNEAELHEGAVLAKRPGYLANEPGVDDLEPGVASKKAPVYVQKPRMREHTPLGWRSSPIRAALANMLRRARHGSHKRSTGQFLGNFAVG